MHQDDPRLTEAKARPIAEIVNLLDLQGLKRNGHELIGPCPDCGGTDRFGVNTRKGLFQCRVCGIKGDGLDLVMAVRHLDFKAALTWLCGDAEITPAERAERLARARAAQAEAEAKAARFRTDAIAAARAIWLQGEPPQGTAVEDYLQRRSIDISEIGGFPAAIRFHPALRYTVGEGRERRVIHTGPAMLAAIQGPDGKFSGVHRTWLDLTQPKGKARILHPATGETCDAKKVLGSKKGGAIRLTGALQAPVMVCGEGLETTWSAMMASAAQDPSPPAFWCLVDLGNMAGRQQDPRRHTGLPDLDDAEAFVPPAWVERLIYVMDGDSDPKATRSKLVAGLRRAMALRPGIRGQIAAAPNGRDLNDVLMGVE